MLKQAAIIAIAILLGAGCTPPPPTAEPQKMSVLAVPAAGVVDPKDATPAAQFVVQLDVYQLTVPFGCVSNNDALWKHVNEEHLDILARDVLYLNGVRVGQAPIAEWGFFQTLIDAQGAQVVRNSCIAGDGKSIELMMKRGIREQCIFISNPPADPQGRSFDECENYMALSFWAEARRRGDVHLKLCPVVRSARKRLESTLLDGNREFKFVSPERLYDLKLEASVPLDS